MNSSRRRPASAHRLVPGDAEPQAVGTQCGEGIPDVPVQIFLAEVLGFPGRGPPFPLLIQVESGPELLEDLTVVTTLSDDSAEHGRESVPGDAPMVMS